jgi:hypothetical protein
MDPLAGRQRHAEDRHHRGAVPEGGGREIAGRDQPGQDHQVEREPQDRQGRAQRRLGGEHPIGDRHHQRPAGREQAVDDPAAPRTSTWSAGRGGGGAVGRGRASRTSSRIATAITSAANPSLAASASITTARPVPTARPTSIGGTIVVAKARPATAAAVTDRQVGRQRQVERQEHREHGRDREAGRAQRQRQHRAAEAGDRLDEEPGAQHGREERQIGRRHGASSHRRSAGATAARGVSRPARRRLHCA